MEKIGILGGSFNPPHIAHLILADQVYHALQLDKVLFMPSGIPPHQHEKKVIDSPFRKEMVQRAIQGHEGFALESYEIDRPGKHYTFDTIQALKKKYPNAQFYFIIGGDMVDYLPTWYKIDELVKLVTFVGVNRPGSAFKTAYPLVRVDMPPLDMSSSIIRNYIKTNQSIMYFVPENVRQYIEEKRLYHD